MDKQLLVLLIEDDMNACNDISKYMDELEDISLIGITNDSGKGLEYVKDFLPHAVILDLELHQGSGNGLLFLQELKELDLTLKPYILVTTNNSSAITYDYARQLGADFIMAKHQSDYSSEHVVEFLRMMKDPILNKPAAQTISISSNRSPAQQNKRISRKISIELDLVGISPKAVGYQYLIDAILLILKKPETNLSSVIASKYGKTDSSVERAMQNAINKAWRTSDIDDLSKYYTAKINSDRGVPTLTEFVFYYAHKIKNDL